MKFAQVVPLLFSSLAIAAPAALPALVPDKTINERAATTICGQYDSVATGTYTVYQDLWGEDNATSGSQCSTVDSLSSETIVWSTSWTWAGGAGSVKSYANVALTTTGVQISAISEIPTVWDYSYTGTSLVADVSYDIFTSSSATGSNEFEVMVWLAALGGAGPISSTGSAVASPEINGVTWDLYSGPNGDTTVYSFVAQTETTSFSGDILLFFAYLEDNYDFSTSQYITTLEAGTEPFSGTDAVLTVSAYSVSITSGSSSAVEAVVAVSSSTEAAVQATSTPVKVAASSAQAPTTTAMAVSATVAPQASSVATKASSACVKKSSSAAAVQATTVAVQASATSAQGVAASTGTASTGSTSGTIAKYYQCGGTGFTGTGSCVSGTTCVFENTYYSQCQ